MNLKEYDNLTYSDLVLGNKKEGKYVAYNYYGFLKHMKKTTLPKTFRPMLHYLGEGNILIICSLHDKLVFYNYNTTNNKMNELVNFSLAEHFHVGGEFIHHQSFLLNSKYVYLIKNSFPSDDEHIYIYDLNLRRLDSIKNDDTRPSSFRINYTVNLYDFRLIFFGGMDFSLTPLNHIEAFNLLTYKWEKIETKGKSPEPRHSHNSFIVGHNLYILGGTSAKDIFSKHGCFDDFFMLNLNSLTWTPIKMYGTPPKNLTSNYSFQLSEKYIIFLACEAEEEEDNMTQVYRFDSTHFEWENIQSMSSQPEFRFGAGSCLDDVNMVAYIFGGIYFSRIESQSLTNEMDRIKFCESKEGFEKLELLSSDKMPLDLSSKSKEEPKLEKETTPNAGKNVFLMYSQVKGIRNQKAFHLRNY